MLWLCVCVCVLVRPIVHACELKTIGVCVCLLCVCVVGTTFVNLYSGAKCGCLCRRPSVSTVCVIVCV